MSAQSKFKFFRLRQIIGDRKSLPAIDPIFPVSRSCWLAGVKTGRFPKPVKISERSVAWRSVDIEALIRSIDAEAKK